MNMINGLEHLPYEERLTLLNLKKRKLKSISCVCVNIWWEGMKMGESSQEYTMTGKEALSTN